MTRRVHNRRSSRPLRTARYLRRAKDLPALERLRSKVMRRLAKWMKRRTPKTPDV